MAANKGIYGLPKIVPKVYSNQLLAVPKRAGQSKNLGRPDGGPVGSTTTRSRTLNRWFYEPFYLVQPIRITEVHCNVITAGTAATNMRIALYTANEDWQPDLLVSDIGLVSIGSIGLRSILNLALDLPSGSKFLIATNSETTPVLQAYPHSSFINTQGSVLGTNGAIEWSIASAFAAAPGNGVPWDTAGAAGTSYGFLNTILMAWSVTL